MEKILTPMNGHSILLMEPEPGKRTFSDFPNVEICLDTLLAMYEENHPGHDSNYTLDHVWRWLDRFTDISLLVFVHELARYKKHTHTEFKELFIQAIQRQQIRANAEANANQNNNHINGTRNSNNDNINGTRDTNNGRGTGAIANADNYHNDRRIFRFDDRDDDDDDDEENWD